MFYYKSSKAPEIFVFLNNSVKSLEKTILEAATKQTKGTGAGLNLYLRALYHQISSSTVSLFEGAAQKVLTTSLDNIEKNPAGGAGALLVMESLYCFGAFPEFEVLMRSKLEKITAPKILKLITSNLAALELFSTFVVNYFVSSNPDNHSIRLSLLSVLVKQILYGRHSEHLKLRLKEVTDGAKFSGISKAFENELASPNQNASSQKSATLAKLIVKLALKNNATDIAVDLINCVTYNVLSVNTWAKCVYNELPELEDKLIAKFNEELVWGEKHERVFFTKIGVLASISEKFAAQVLEKILSGVLCAPKEWKEITLYQINISMTPEEELYDTSVIKAKEDKIDKNSKNYEEEKWALEQKRKLELKRGTMKLNKAQLEAKAKQLLFEKEVRAEYSKRVRSFANTTEALSAIIDSHGRKLRPSLAKFVPELASKLFQMVGYDICSSETLSMMAALVELCGRDCAAPSYCHSIVISTARIASSENVTDNWKEEKLADAISRNLELSPDEDASNFSQSFAGCVSEFANRCLSKDGDKAIVVLKNSFEKLPKIQAIQTLTALVEHMSTSSHASTYEASELVVHVAGSLRLREMNSLDTAVPLVDGLSSESVSCRSACLTALQQLMPEHGKDEESSKLEDYLSHRVYSSRHSTEMSLKILSDQTMADLDLFPPEDSLKRLCDDCSSGIYHLEVQASKALAELLRTVTISEEAEDFALPEEVCVESCNEAMKMLMDAFRVEFQEAGPKFDEVGRLLKNREDRSVRRYGLGAGMKMIASGITSEKAMELFLLLVPDALNDSNVDVAAEMLNVGIAAVDKHGMTLMKDILTLFDKYLEGGKSQGDADGARQSVVVLLGRLASHLPITDPRVKPIIGKLIAALSVPSEMVQKAVANCLPGLVPAIKSDAKNVINGLLSLALESNNYGERRGGASGLAGMVKGLGILSLKKYDILKKLLAAVQDKKSVIKREGALLCFSALCYSLERLFEPFIGKVLPELLESFGDNVKCVREASEEAAINVMKSLSAHGVKLVLPALLKALENDTWRTKVGGVDLLGMMSHCAPKQLSKCLPQIVPYLIDVLADSHPKVSKAGREALGQVGDVIQNPEIKALSNFLLDGLANPAQKIAPALVELNKTRFVHHIDAASLALIMPIVQRAFNERSAETRKLSAQIISGMCAKNANLCTESDLQPYLGSIMPGLKNTLTDPVPDVRATAAKGIGNVVSVSSDPSVTDGLHEWLNGLLTSDSSAVDRSGGAQGLAEVMYAQGEDQLDELIPKMIKMASDTKLAPTVRDGYCMAFIYFPVVFRDQFADFISKIIPGKRQILLFF